MSNNPIFDDIMNEFISEDEDENEEEQYDKNDNKKGKHKSISSLSGGEKKRVDISIQLALYDLIQTVSQSRFNLLCLDEIESLLDPIGCEQLIEIIEDKAENIETVWWITNHPSVKESIPQKILVKKILGKTEVEEI